MGSGNANEICRAKEGNDRLPQHCEIQRWVLYGGEARSPRKARPQPLATGATPKRLDPQGASMFNRRDSMHTYLTKTVGDMTIVYYKHPRLGDCHVAYYTE